MKPRRVSSVSFAGDISEVNLEMWSTRGGTDKETLHILDEDILPQWLSDVAKIVEERKMHRPSLTSYTITEAALAKALGFPDGTAILKAAAPDGGDESSRVIKLRILRPSQ